MCKVRKIVSFVTVVLMLVSLVIPVNALTGEEIGFGYIFDLLAGNKVPVDTDNTGFDADVSFYSNEATVRISPVQITDMLNKSKDLGMIEVDITKALNSYDKPISSASFYKTVLDTIVKESKKEGVRIEGLRVKLSTGSFEADIDALTEIVDKSSGTTVKFHLETTGMTKLNSKQISKLSDYDVVTGCDIYLTSNNLRLTNLKNSSLRVILDDEIAGTNNPYGMKIWYISDKAEMKKLDTRYDKENFTFNTSEFSDFVVVFNANDIGQFDSCAKDEKCPLYGLTDTKMNEWYHDSIHFILDEELMDLRMTKKFEPSENTTRGEIVEALWRLEGKPSVVYNMNYSDVTLKHPNYNSIAWASSKGIVNGYSKTSFGPDDNITREQMVAILYRYCEFKGYSLYNGSVLDLDFFSDHSDISKWALESVRWAVGKGIIKGKGEGILDPLGGATRAEIATMLMNFIFEEKD